METIDPYVDVAELDLLPEEIVAHICNQMSNQSLAYFTQTSKKYKRICGDILENRTENYKTIAEQIIDKLTELTETSYGIVIFELNTLVPNIFFFIAFHIEYVQVLEIEDPSPLLSDRYKNYVAIKVGYLLPDDAVNFLVYLMLNDIIDGTIKNRNVRTTDFKQRFGGRYPEETSLGRFRYIILYLISRV